MIGLPISRYIAARSLQIYKNLLEKHLWQRMVKNTVATTIAVSICLIPAIEPVIGKAAYLVAMATVFGHPGRRFGQLVEALTLVILGVSVGLAWSILGLYLSSLAIHHNPPAAYAIKGLFLTVAVLVHGFLRSYAPRLFPGLILLAIVSTITLLSTAKQVTQLVVTQIMYPILIASAVILLVNLFIFPEFSSSFLGQITIETLNDIAKALEDAGHYFSHTNRSAPPIADVQPSDLKLENETWQNGQSSGQSQTQSDRLTTIDLSNGNLGDPAEKTLSRRMTDVIGRKVRDIAENDNRCGEITKPTGSSRNFSLNALTSVKESLRQKLQDCKAAQDECNFEIAFSVLPPRSLKVVSSRSMAKLLANTVATISTCESKFALIGDSVNDESTAKHQNSGRESPQVQENADENMTKAELDLIKPRREIEFGDVRLLRFLLQRIDKPYAEASHVVFKTISLITTCIAYTYDVPKLPSGARAPDYMGIEDLDEALSNLQAAMHTFDADTVSALESAAIQQELEGFEPDIMPREEIFLISSFLLNFSQAATQIQDMLKHCRQLVDERQQRHGRRRFYAPKIKWARWLFSGGEQDEALPAVGRKANREGAATKDAAEDADDDARNSRDNLLKAGGISDVERAAPEDGPGHREPSPPSRVPAKDSVQKTETEKPTTLALRVRGRLADLVEWMQESDDFLYASKLTMAVFIVSWPALVASWNTWFSLNRGVWATLQLIFVTELSLGTSIWTFIVRGIGTTLGCLWGWAAYEALYGQRVVCAVMICIGVIPSTYVQLGTKYPKAGMVSIISTGTENFLKRWIAFMIGGIVALIVEMVLLPVKARTRLVESIAAVIRQINEMENAIAAGIEEGLSLDIFDSERIVRFEHASAKANGALSAAETFLPFCSTEPRIKGSFESLGLIYSEVLFVLHQIIDRMNNMVQLRTAYGSGPLEEFNVQIYPYRRNVAGSITITLFAIHGALTTKIPLPQFLPSARLAHLRMVNRVREVVQQSFGAGKEHEETSKMTRQLALRRKYMAWNAASAAQAEIIEFLEELIDLTKLLMGASEFRSGMLTRPTYHHYDGPQENVAEPAITVVSDAEMDDEARDVFKNVPPNAVITRRKRATTRGSKASSENDDDIPASLRRIQSRKIEAGIRRQSTNDSWNQNP